MMKRLHWNIPEDRALLIDNIIENKIFLGSTDTVLGIMGQVTQIVKLRIDKLKMRDRKPYVVLLDSTEKVELLCVFSSDRVKHFLKQCWPGPLTVILSVRPEYQWIAESTAIAVRIPDHDGLQQILHHLPIGLYSTSANISGHPVPTKSDEIDERIENGCSYYIDNNEHSAEPFTIVPSTIIDLSQGAFTVVRSGAYPITTLRKLYQDLSD